MELNIFNCAAAITDKFDTLIRSKLFQLKYLSNHWFFDVNSTLITEKDELNGLVY